VDFHVLGSFKIALKGHRFESDKDVKAAVVWWFQQQPNYFSAEGIHWLECQCDSFFSAHWNYF
jgi:hypothetical protein